MFYCAHIHETASTTERQRKGLLRVADLSYRHRRLVVLIWLLALVATAGLAQRFGGDFTIDFKTPASESSRAQDLLESKFPARAGDDIDVVFKADAGISDASVTADINALLAKAKSTPHVVSVTSPYDTTGIGAFQVSPDRTVAFASLQLDTTSDKMPQDVTRGLIAETKAANRPGLQVDLGGFAVEHAEQQGAPTMIVGVGAAIVILCSPTAGSPPAGCPAPPTSRPWTSGGRPRRSR